MLIPTKFNGYVQNVRLYNAMGGVGEAALIGAAIGGGSAAITGGDPLKGALLGGLTGGAGAGISGMAAGVAPAAEGLAAGAGGAAGTAAGTTAGAAAGTTAGTAAGTGAGIDALAAQNIAANPGLYPAGSMGTNTATMFTPSGGAYAIPSAGSNAAAATAPVSSFDAAMNDPSKYIGDNKLRMFSAGLAGATGARKENEVPGQEEYNGPLKRFNPFDPSKYRQSSYAGGGITMLAAGGYDQQVGDDPYPQDMASGGIANLGSYSDGGRMLRGPGDGMSDSIPANISGKRPARLADGEFVVPADVVSHLGNGSTDAGAKTLYSMMDKVRTARTGRKSQGKQINAGRYTPT